MINQTDEEKHFGLIDSLKLASSHDRNASFVLIFIFSVSVSVMIGVPIMFKEPLIYCLDSNNNNSTFVCTEVEACSNNYIYYIDKVNGPRSFTTDFELICENSSKKRVALTMNFFGFFVGCFIITFYTISASVRKNVIGFFSFVYGVSLILMLVFSDSLFLISIFLFIASFSFICLNAYIYVFITENFVGDLASSMMILVNIGAASWGMFFAAFAFFVNSNWRLFLGLAGVLMTIGGIYFWVLPFPKRYEKGLENDKVSLFLFFLIFNLTFRT